MAGGVYVEGEKAEGSADRTTLRAMSLEVTPPDGETQVANSFGNSSRVCGGGVLRPKELLTISHSSILAQVSSSHF